VYTDLTNNVITGRRWQQTFQPGRSYRLRFVKAAIETHFRIALDGHRMTIIAADFVPTEPYTTEVLRIGIGQRYNDVVGGGQQTAGDWWLRAVPQTACSAVHVNGDNIHAIIRYDDGASSRADPTSTSWDFGDFACDDEPLASLVPAKAPSCRPRPSPRGKGIARRTFHSA